MSSIIGKPEKVFRCQCGKDYTTSAALQIHIKNKHVFMLNNGKKNAKVGRKKGRPRKVEEIQSTKPSKEDKIKGLKSDLIGFLEFLPGALGSEKVNLEESAGLIDKAMFNDEKVYRDMFSSLKETLQGIGVWGLGKRSSPRKEVGGKVEICKWIKYLLFLTSSIVIKKTRD